MKCSILLSVHFGACKDFLEECLLSLETQTFPASEIIIVEDGPIPESLNATLTEFEQRLFIYRVKLPTNRGLARALNEGLSVCTYSLVARIDADDVCFPERLEKQVRFFEAHPETDILGSFVVEIDNSGKKRSVRRMPLDHETLMDSLWSCPLLHPTIMFRKNRILEVGGYDTSLWRRQDYDLWFRCAAQGLQFANIPEPLLYYRFEPTSHKKQPPKLALQQGVIGFKGSKQLQLAYWKRLACFIPFFRSLLPNWLQHMLYTVMRQVDPRQ